MNASHYLVEGFTKGFRIGCLDIPPPSQGITHNLKSAGIYPHIIQSKIDKELVNQRIMGPYDSPPIMPNFRISPLGVVPKKAPGEYRMIHHLSYPEKFSVNDFIPHEHSTVQYASIQDAIRFIQNSKTTVYMAKVDIESAFRIIPVSPIDRPLLGFHWAGKFYMDAVLPMGCSSSCAIFEEFSTALHWIAKAKLGVTEIVHVIDDFLILACSPKKCTHDLEAFSDMCEQLGVPLAPEKTVGPSTEIIFLGITLDTVKLEARLPLDKLATAGALLDEFLTRQKVTLRELQSVIGVLNFACSVILPGRAFLRRLIDLTMGVSKPHHHIRLTQEVKLDLQMWKEFLHGFNGRAFFIDEKMLSGDYLQLYTDASGEIGYGAVLGNEWFWGLWPTEWRAFNIAVLELYPIVAAVGVWGNQWENKSVCFYTDNQALVSILNKQTSREKVVMRLIRTLVVTCLKWNIHFIAKHIPGRLNTLADSLSRCQVDQFKALAPWANPRPTRVSHRLLPVGLSCP